MKKLLLGLTLLVSLSSFAEITESCRNEMDELIIDNQKFEVQVPRMLAEGRLTESEVESLRESQNSLVEMAALKCKIQRKVQLERTFLGMFRLLSQETAEYEGNIAFEEAIQYYERNK